MFQKFLFEPIYNLLVFFTDIVPGGNIGLAVILVTILIKIILFPLTKKFIHTQIQMRAIQPELKAIQKQYKDNRQKMGEEQLRVYREHGVNPFSGILLMIIQIPILWAIFKVFREGIDPTLGAIPFREDLLYSFVAFPEKVSLFFLGLDLTQKSLILALIVGVAQYFHMRLLSVKPEEGTEKDSQQEMQEKLQKNMRYFMPALTTVIAASFPSALALYWLTNTVFSIGQEYSVRRKEIPEIKKELKEAKK